MAERGRPKIYTEEYVKELQLKLEKYIENTPIPIVAEFAYKNNITRPRLYEIAEQNENFSYTMKKIIDKKESQLERQALSGEVNATMAVFSLKQLGWSDKVETKHSGTMNVNNSYKEMSDEELEKLASQDE